MLQEKELWFLDQLTEAKIISDSEKNLRSKIDSILRSLENLSAKQARIEFEIKKQKKSLTRKRQELKKVQKSSTRKLSVAIEEQTEILGYCLDDVDLQELRRLDSKLLAESSRILED